MQTAKAYDPDQVRNEFTAKKRRQGRLQLTPPMSYWNQYDEKLAEEEAELKRMEDAMDRIGIFLGIICISLFIALLCFHERIFWLPPLIASGTVIWWLGWGRHKY